MNNIGKLTQERIDEITKQLMIKGATKDFASELSVQELIYLIVYLNDTKHKKVGFNIKFSVDILYKAIAPAIKNLGTLYVIINKDVKNIFIHDKCADVFTDEEFANIAVEHYTELGFSLQVEKIEKDNTGLPQGIDLFTYFYYLGINAIMIDNGQYNTVIKRSEILSNTTARKNNDFNCETDNPDLRFAINAFHNEIKSPIGYNGKEKYVETLNNLMTYEVGSSKNFLIPVKFNGERVDNIEELMKNSSKYTLTFAKYQLNNDGKMFTPIFTDKMEFNREFDDSEWNYILGSFNTPATLGKCDGVVINPLAEKLIILENIFPTIIQTAKKFKK